MENIKFERNLPSVEDLRDIQEALVGTYINDAMPGDNTLYIRPDLIPESISKLEAVGYVVTARKDNISYEITKEGKFLGEIYPN